MIAELSAHEESTPILRRILAWLGGRGRVENAVVMQHDAVKLAINAFGGDGEAYMAADNCRAGCLMITISTDRHWTHPDTAVSLDFAGLITFLGEEADAIMTRMPGALRLTVCGLDLRARLPTERAGARRSRSEPSLV